MFYINDFDINVTMNGDADNFALVTVTPKNGKFTNYEQKSFPIERATPEDIGKAIAQYIRNTFTEYDSDNDFEIGDVAKVIGSDEEQMKSGFNFAVGKVGRVVEIDNEKKRVLIMMGSIECNTRMWYNMDELEKGELIWSPITRKEEKNEN